MDSGVLRLTVAQVLTLLSGIPLLFVGLIEIQTKSRPDAFARNLLIGLGVVFGLSLLSMLRRFLRKDRWPDYMAEISQGIPFELCGVQLLPDVRPSPAVPGAPLRYAFFFQNRFDRQVSLRLQLVPDPEYRGSARHTLSTVLEVEVGPGQVGLTWQEVTLPEDTPSYAVTLQGAGKKLTRGAEMRFRLGNPIRDVDRARLIQALGALASGNVPSDLPEAERIEVEVGTGGDALAPAAEPQGTIVIWNPGDGDEETQARFREACELQGYEAWVVVV